MRARYSCSDGAEDHYAGEICITPDLQCLTNSCSLFRWNWQLQPRPTVQVAAELCVAGRLRL